MKSTRLRHLLFLLTSTAALHAQSLIEQDCTIQIQSTGVKLLNWTGHVGRTYFIQSSPDLANWSWAPNIEAGENRPMSYEVDGPAKAGFFRLQYTDLTAPNLDAADFDGDGLNNLEEITQRPRPAGASLNQSLQTSSAMAVLMSTRQISRVSTRATPSQNIQTNPLKADTDDDGLNDKWEEDHQLDPTDNGSNNINNGPNGDPDGDGVDNLSELQNGTNPMNEDTNGDGVSDSDDYHSAPLVWPVIWTHNFIEAWAAKSTPLFREFVPTISSANPTPIVRWYMQKDISGFNGQSTSFPTNLHDSYRVRERVDPDSGEVTYSITEEPIEQEQGPWLDFENGNWYIESESHHEVTKTRDFYESIDHVTLRTLGITGVETHRYETNLSNEFTTAMLMQDLGERFNELQREKEQEPWNFGGSGISGITSFISRSEEKSQKMKCDYAMEPPSSPVSSNVRIAWLEVSAPNPYRGDIAIDDDPRPPVVKLYQEFFTAARLVQFNRPIDSSQPASPKTAVHTLSPDQNQEMKVIPLACELKLYHRLGTLVANQQTGGTIAPTPDWSAPTNGSLGWSISGTLGSRPQANDSPQNTDVLWDEFNVPIRLEVIEGAENIRLATRSDAGNGIESFTPVTLPIADLREYPSGFVLQSTGPGRVVIRASLVTKHGLRIVSTTEGLMGLLDLDVDSDNSGEIDGSLAEDEMEADPAQPGKLFVYTPSSGDAPGSPESWVEVSLKTSSLRARDKVQFNYDDDQMTIWNSRPDQNPAPDKRVVAGQAYMLTELGIVPGTPKSFYVRPGQECSGRQLISVHIIATNQSNGTSSDQVAVNLLPVDLISDLNNDGQITTADNSLRDAAMASGATDEIKDKGTEFIFHNDTLSNGIWDKEDNDPARPATEKDDDDAEEITIKPGITEGEVWLDHPAIAGLSFYKTRECIDKVNLSPTSKFTVSASNPFPDKLFMRADGTLTYPDANPQFEGDLVLKIKVGTNGQEIEAVKMKLTVVKGFGADKYFNASRDYTFESNTKLIVRDIKYASSTFRICTICEELSTLRPIETYHDDPTPDPEHKSPRGIRQVMDVNPDMTIITNGNMVYFSSGMSKWESAIVLALGSTSMTDKCQGGIISDGSGYLNPSSTEAGAVLKPGEGLLAQNTAKFVAQGIDGKWIFDKGHLPKSPPPRAGLGGLSTNYESYARAGADRQFVGYWPHQVGGEDRGCVFTATHIAGNQDVDKFVAAAKTSKVPPFETTRLKLFMLDSGDAAVALAHLSPNGSLKLADFQQANILRLQASYQAGVPYFPNTYMAFKTIKPRN